MDAYTYKNNGTESSCLSSPLTFPIAFTCVSSAPPVYFSHVCLPFFLLVHRFAARAFPDFPCTLNAVPRLCFNSLGSGLVLVFYGISAFVYTWWISFASLDWPSRAFQRLRSSIIPLNPRNEPIVSKVGVGIFLLPPFRCCLRNPRQYEPTTNGPARHFYLRMLFMAYRTT